MKKHLLLFVLALFSFCMEAWAAVEKVDEGTCGDYLKWIRYRDTSSGLYQVEISGTGVMEDYLDLIYVPFFQKTSYWNKSTNQKTNKITIGEGVTTIGNYAFFQCDNSSLTSITLPATLVKIGMASFTLCKNLKTITIPENVRSIGADAFRECNGLTSVTCHALTPPTLGTEGWGVFDRSTTRIPNLYVPEESLSDYKNSAWADFFTNISAIPTSSGPFTIRFIADSKLITTEKLNYGASINAPFVPSTDYHTFSWNDLPETMPARNVTVRGYNYPNTYYISYKVDGSLYKTVGYKYFNNVTPPANPTKEGYTFTGWNPALPNLMPGKNLTVDASFEVNKYTLTYQVDGVQYGDVKTYEYGATITPVTAPTKAGHTFSGWQGLPTEMPAQNTIVTGSFTANTYTVTYMVDGTKYAEQTYSYGSSVKAPAENPTKNEHIFTGWKDLPSTMSDKNVTVTGSFIPACGENVGWTLVNGTLTIKGTGAMYDYEQETDVPWYSSRESITTVKIESGITDIGKYAFWGCKKLTSLTLPSTGLQRIGAAAFYKCAFTSINIPEGVTQIDDAAFRYCESLTTVTIPSTVKFVGEAAFNECHKLSSFTSRAKTAPQFMTIVLGSNFSNAFLNIDANAKLIYPSGSDYSSWLPYFKGNKFTLTYKVGNTETGTQQYACGETITPLASPTQTGYTFAGWENLPSTMPAKNITITGSFTINQYTITFDTGGGSAVNPIKQNYGVAVTAPAAPTKTGYTFAGWDKTIPSTMPAENVTITAKWKVNQYTITFNTDGGSSVATITQDYGTAVNAPANPTKEGYTFNGWNPALPSTMPAKNETHTAQWTINQYTITFDTNGGSAVSPINADYGTAVTAPAAPTKTGYTFAGWDKTIPSTMPAGDMTIKAKWTINKYTITFNTDGGTEIAAIKQDYNTNVKTPADPIKEGYTFTGWDKQIPKTMPAEDMTITAQWAIGQYSITFETDGGTAVNSIVQDYGTAITAPAAPTKEGYTFAGWEPAVPATMPEGGLTVKAQWTANQYTITFDVDGGTAVKPITKNYGTEVTAPADPTKKGYTFAGWEPALPETMPVGGMTIKAQWTINQYTITFDTDGGSEIAAITQDYNTDVKAPAEPTKEGYTFIGWNEEIPAKMPAENITIKAQWTYNPTIVDGEEYTATENMQAASLTYTRTLPNTKWNALYVPFEIPVSMLGNYEVAYVNDVHSYDTDDDGIIDDFSMEIIKIKSGVLNANYPYLIRAKNDEAKAMSITLNDITLYAAEENSVDCSSVVAEFKVTGTYSKIAGSEFSTNEYALSNGTWVPIAAGSYLKPGRLYLQITEREGTSPVKVSTMAMTRINIHVKGEESSTSVEEMIMQGQQPKEEVIYDLMGRRVQNPVKGHIYIVNGKKRVY